MKIVLFGANGQIGTEVTKLFQTTAHNLIPLTRCNCDLSDANSIQNVLNLHKANLIINAAAYTNVDQAEDEPRLAQSVNADAVGEIATFCSLNQTPLIHLSTDYVFDGIKQTPYHEEDLTNPINVYGRTKLEGEGNVQKNLANFIILRVSWVFGVYGKNFVKSILKLASERSSLNVVNDQYGAPTSAKDIARVILCITDKISKKDFDQWGVYHYSGKEATNWYEFALTIWEIAKLHEKRLVLNNLDPIASRNYPTKASRPEHSILSTEKIKQVFDIDSHAWIDDLTQVVASLS